MTLAEAIEEVRHNLNEPAAVFWSDAEITRRLNREYRSLAAEMNNSHLNFYYKYATVNNASTGTTFYPYINIPTDCDKIMRVTKSDGVPLPDLRNEWFGSAYLTESGEPTGWTIFGNYIMLNATPGEEYDYTIEYYYIPTALTQTTDSFVFPIGFDDVLTYGATIRCAIKDDVSLDEIRSIYMQRKGAMLSSLTTRQAATTPHVLAVEGQLYD